MVAPRVPSVLHRSARRIRVKTLSNPWLGGTDSRPKDSATDFLNPVSTVADSDQLTLPSPSGRGRKLCAIQQTPNLSRLGTFEISGRAALIVSAISIPVAVAALAGTTALTAALHPDLGSASVIEIGLPFLVGLAATLVVHEGVHAAAFLVPGGHPRLGLMSKGHLPFLSVSCPDRLFRRMPFIAVGLAPLILLDLVALGLLADLHTVGFATAVLCINTAGSVGDLWLAGIVLSRGSTIRWEAAAGNFVLWGPSPYQP